MIWGIKLIWCSFFFLLTFLTKRLFRYMPLTYELFNFLYQRMKVMSGLGNMMGVAHVVSKKKYGSLVGDLSNTRACWQTRVEKENWNPKVSKIEARVTEYEK